MTDFPKEEKNSEKPQANVEQNQDKKEENPEDKFKQKEVDIKLFCCVPTLIKTNYLMLLFQYDLPKSN